LGTYSNEAGVENVTVTDSVFTKTANGVRIKSWAKPSNGYARDIEFRNLIMQNVYNPIIIDQRYCSKRECPHQVGYCLIRGLKIHLSY
jgi:polygalacturonase